MAEGHGREFMEHVVERVAPDEFRLLAPELGRLLIDVVEGGASVGFLRRVPVRDVERFCMDCGREVADGSRVQLVVRFSGRVVGAVQLGLCMRPNGRHRAEVQKLMVHSEHRRRGIAAALMRAVETVALDDGRWLLFLDTETGSPAEALYARLGWSRVGTIPDYALTPDGALGSTTLFFKRLVVRPEEH
jgi:ribosomal protein S18 acetylase RimI-like enzyme